MRRGFTLIEVTIALVILGIIGVAATRLLMMQSRFYDKMSNQRNARSIARSSMAIMLSDLRMVQDSLGVDSASADGKTLRILVPYRFGLVCSAGLLSTTVSMLPADSATIAQSVYNGFAWRDTTTGLYHYVTGSSSPASASSPATCTGNSGGQAQIRTVSMNGRSGAAFDISTIGSTGAPVGTPIFFWSKITYSFKASSMPQYAGYLGLYRKTVSGSTTVDEELLAPFDTTARFRYYTVGDDTSRTVVPAAANIRGVDLVLNSLSPKITSEKNATHSPSYMETSVFFKNTRTF